jgi:hypothetical protein
MADHRQQAFFWAATVDIAIPRAHRAERRTKVSSDRVQNGFAEGQTPGRVPYQGRKDVSWSQNDARGNAQGFLSAPKENATVDFPGAVEAGEFVIENPR